MARILAARKIQRENIVVCLDGDEMDRACVQDYFVEQSSGGHGVVVILTNSGHFARGSVVNMGCYRNVESLVGLVVEKLG